MTPLHELTIAEARALLDKGEISSVELTQACLDRIVAVDNQVRAFLAIDDESALEQARAADEDGRDNSGLLGIPLAIKDVISTEGLTTTCGSKMLEEYTPPYDATVIQRLKNSGAVLLGKTNCDEFAMGSSTENSAFFPTRNPWDRDRVPGGSSGGSAAAVAACEAPAALGTDTGGSIRQPAALCGVAGLKPTYGRVSRYGLVAFASSLDQIGPLGRTVADLALAARCLFGRDPLDATSADQPVPDFDAALAEGARGIRVGVPWSFLEKGVDEAVLSGFRASLDALRGAGASLVEVALPHLPHAIATYYVVATAEASSNLARFDGVRYGLRVDSPDLRRLYGETRDRGFGPEVKRRIILGTFVLSSGYYDAYYLRAQQVRTLIRADFERAFGQCDVVATPTTPTPAFRLGEKADDPLQMYLADIFTVPANLAGIPGLSVPCGFAGGLPVGLQLLGRPFDEATLLRAGHGYQQQTDFHRQFPPGFD